MFGFKVLPECRIGQDTLAEHGVRLNHLGEVATTLKLRRRDLVAIRNGNKVIYRVVVFGASGRNRPESIGKSSIRLTYDSLIDLDIQRDARARREITLEFKKVGGVGEALYWWHHPDNGIRSGVRFAVLLLFIDKILGFALTGILSLL